MDDHKYLDRCSSWRIESGPVACDERILEFSGHRVQDEHGSKPKNEMLGLTNDLLEQGFLGCHLCWSVKKLEG